MKNPEVSLGIGVPGCFIPGSRVWHVGDKLCWGTMHTTPLFGRTPKDLGNFLCAQTYSVTRTVSRLSEISSRGLLNSNLKPL